MHAQYKFMVLHENELAAGTGVPYVCRTTDIILMPAVSPIMNGECNYPGLQCSGFNKAWVMLGMPGCDLCCLSPHTYIIYKPQQQTNICRQWCLHTAGYWFCPSSEDHMLCTTPLKTHFSTGLILKDAATTAVLFNDEAWLYVVPLMTLSWTFMT